MDTKINGAKLSSEMQIVIRALRQVFGTGPEKALPQARLEEDFGATPEDYARLDSLLQKSVDVRHNVDARVLCKTVADLINHVRFLQDLKRRRENSKKPPGHHPGKRLGKKMAPYKKKKR